MRTVTHRELRNSSGEILRAVAAGESVQITNNGHLAAVISPPDADPLARGGVRRARRPLSALAGIRRRAATHTSAELIADSRGTW